MPHPLKWPATCRRVVEWMEFPSRLNDHNRCIGCECQPVFPCGELTKVQVIHGNLCLQYWIQILTRDALDMFFDYIVQQHCAMSTVVLSVCNPVQKCMSLLVLLQALSYAPDLQCAIMGGRDGMLVLWDINSGETKRELSYFHCKSQALNKTPPKN